MDRFFVFAGEGRPSQNLKEGDHIVFKAYEQLIDAFESIDMLIDHAERLPDCLVLKGESRFGGRDMRVEVVMNLRCPATDTIRAYRAN